MSLASTCVRRPVTASMFYLAIFLLGAISWFMTPRELFPSISFPQLLVITRYGNAAPEEIAVRVHHASARQRLLLAVAHWPILMGTLHL